MKKIIFFAISIFIALPLFSEIFTIKDTDIFEFIESYKTNKSFNPKNNNLWTGTITEIIENKDLSEVKIIKSRWIKKKEIQTVNITLKVTNKEILDKIKKIGINNKIVFICYVDSITKDLEIISVPLLIKEL